MSRISVWPEIAFSRPTSVWTHEQEMTRMRTYQSKVTVKYKCAFRCEYCSRISVTDGSYQIASGGQMSPQAAHAQGALIMMKKLPQFFKNVNQDHNLYRLNAGAECTSCGREQAWAPCKKPWIFQLILTVLFAAILTAVIYTLGGDRITLPLVGGIVVSLILSACFWTCYGFLVSAIHAKRVGNQLLAQNLAEECYPLIGIPETILSMAGINPEDPRAKAIAEIKK